jgi:hypothetical protein
VYSGSWVGGVKHGSGCYEYGANKSKLNGTWESGSIVTGSWIFEGSGAYTGDFKNGKPLGPGSFTFVSGITHLGEYSTKPVGEDDGDQPPADPTWSGVPVYSSVAK